MLLHSSRRKYCCSSSCTRGMRVDPPTSTTSSTCVTSSLASRMTRLTVSMHRVNRSLDSDSSLARDTTTRRSLPSSRSSTSTVALALDDSSRLARSAALRSRRIARLLDRTPSVTPPTPSPLPLLPSLLSSALASAAACALARPRPPPLSPSTLRSNSAAKKSTRRSSKSSPPRCVSPPVASTSNTPPLMARIDTSNVPPPRSKTTTRLGPEAAPLVCASLAAMSSP
mmetsp:Transcript_29212/g.95286  ORF Transcript_29212/g.95286 Transcript_29212/m.95286 type:complete len:227 (-) Transcript_29212:124-804(-)